MNRRALILTGLLLLAGLGRWQLQAVAPAPAPDLATLPLRLQEWSGVDAPPFEARVMAALGADDYVNRYYRSGDRLANVYVGYYRTQRFGSTIHSPLNCLPGAGWQPLERSLVDVGPGLVARQLVVQKDDDRRLVVYWYQTASRVDASEYWNKWHLIVDAMTSRRNDAALVRIIVPSDAGAPETDRAARVAALRVAALLQPELADRLFGASSERERP